MSPWTAAAIGFVIGVASGVGYMIYLFVTTLLPRRQPIQKGK